MSLFISNSSDAVRPRSLVLLAVLALAACGDDSPTGGNGAGPEGGSNQGGQASGPGGNGVGGAPQGGDAPGGASQGGNAQGGTAEGGAPQGGRAQGGNAEGGNAEGGSGGGSGTPSIAAICQAACGYMAGCFGGDPADCIVECSADLGDCSPTELDEVDSCNQAAMNDCDLVDAFSDCLGAVGCIMGAP